jgi:Radical SAM superfamily
MKGLLVFPPIHDFTMPYLAAPLIKGFIEKNDPDIKITCADLNLAFFESAIKNYSHIVEGFRGAFQSPSLTEAVSDAVLWQNRALEELEDHSRKHHGHAWSLRNYRAPCDRQSFSHCIEYSRNSTPYDRLYLEFISRYSQPDFFAVSLTVVDQILPTFRLLRLARENWPGVPIILGGNLINRIGRFMNHHELNEICDFIILREGEQPFLELLRRIRGNGNGVVTDPRIIELKSSSIPAMGELDNIPQSIHTNLDNDFEPDFSDLDIQSYLSPTPILPILMSRKCYWGRCGFCTIHSAWDPLPRRRTADAILREFHAMSQKHKTRYFRVVDEACPPDLLSEVCDLMRVNPIDMRFEIYAILEKRFLDEEMVKKIGASGCRQAFWGLESTDATTIRNMSKEINRTHDVSKIFASTASNGIHNYTFTMYGFPGQDLAAQNRTIEYVISEKNIHTACVSNFSPELEAPYTINNSDQYIHLGQMTEQYSEYYSNGRRLPTMDLGVNEAERAQREIYTRRPDLALTALLKEEIRFVLSDKFGPDFAQQFVSMNPNIALDIDTITKIASDERIRRRLT